jgi:hypothetical protein
MSEWATVSKDKVFNILKISSRHTLLRNSDFGTDIVKGIKRIVSLKQTGLGNKKDDGENARLDGNQKNLASTADLRHEERLDGIRSLTKHR